jgi:hypothetical protein
MLDVLDLFTRAGLKGFWDWYGPDPVLQEQAMKCCLELLLSRQIGMGSLQASALEDCIAPALSTYGAVTERSLVLCLLSFCNDVALLERSRKIISKEWSAHTFQKAGMYKPNAWEGGDNRGVSLVLSFEYPPVFRTELSGYLSRLGVALRETEHHHMTDLNLAIKVPEPQANAIADAFRTRWSEALKETCQGSIQISFNATPHHRRASSTMRASDTPLAVPEGTQVYSRQLRTRTTP